MDPSGAGEIAAGGAGKRAKLQSGSGTGVAVAVDRLSALPDDLLVKILSSVSSPDAVGTCVLSPRWRSVWKLLPDLHLPFFPDAAGAFRDALDGHQVPLRHLKVEGHGGRPSSLATWLPAAARRVTGCFALLVTETEAPTRDDEDEVAIELPCFELATSISIDLSFRGMLAFPPPAGGGGGGAGAGAGVFSRLTDLELRDVLFQDPSALGDAVSSPRSPCLKTVHVCHGCGLEKLAVRSTSLVKLHVERLHGLLELAVDAPELKELHVVHCFCVPPEEAAEPELSIAAPKLVVLEWRDSNTQNHLHFGDQLPRLHTLGSFMFCVYGDDDADSYNQEALGIVQGFRSIKTLTLILGFAEDIIDGYEYLMEAMTVLPDISTLHLIVLSSGHCFGDSSLHVLRICTGITKLILELSSFVELKEPLTCPLDCICREHSNWQTEKLELVCLQEIEIKGFGRSDHDIGFVEQLFGWASSLTKATIFFDKSVPEGVAEELSWMFRFSMPKLHIEFRYHNNKKVLSEAEE